MRKIQEHGPTDNDELSLAQTTERSTWGLPSQEGELGQHPGVILTPTSEQYAEGIFVGHDLEADAQPYAPASHNVRARVDVPHSFELPHESTHRRYEPPFMVPISQAAAGFTLLVPPKMGLHYVKVLAVVLFMSAGGTLKLVQGSTDGTSTADVTGAMPIAANGGFVLPPAELANPWFFTAPDQALGLFTVTGLAAGYMLAAYSPYDQ